MAPLFILPKSLGVAHTKSFVTPLITVKVNSISPLLINMLSAFSTLTVKLYFMIPVAGNVRYPVIHPVIGSPVSPGGNIKYLYLISLPSKSYPIALKEK